LDNRLKNMDYIFHPRSVAFLGATETIPKWGAIVFNNLISGGFDGELYPVNPGRDQVFGHKAYASVRDIPGDVDLAVFTIPADQVMAAIDDCVARGVKAGVIISAGFREKGGEFADMEARLVARARAGNMVLVGPNCNGVSCPRAKLFPWFNPIFAPAGSVGVVSQSGVIADHFTGLVANAGFGVSKTVSSGNEADLKSEDYYEYFSEDPTVDVIVSYVEGISDGRRFIEKTRAAASKKPIIVFKGGRTEYGVSAASSHTGAMAVNSDVFESICKQAGVIRARDVVEAGTMAVSFINRPLPRGRRVGIITGAGGVGVIASDVCFDEGLEVVRLSDETLAKINGLMPDWWVPGNPVDFVAGFNYQSIKPVIEIIMRSGEVDSIILLMGGPRRMKPTGAQAKDKKTENILAAMKGFGKALESMNESIYELMYELDVPIYAPGAWDDMNGDEKKKEKHVSRYPSVESICRAISVMADYFERNK